MSKRDRQTLSEKLPFWKLKREFLRLWMQLGIPFELLVMPYRRRLYDRNKHDFIKISPGAQPLRNNAAIVLVFQPNGVSDSLYETLQHLNDNDFTPFVVSNSDLSDADRERLCEKTHLVLERPNSGYDFGGYREGVLHLLKNGIIPENLVLLNDSVWFPVKKNCDFLEKVKEESTDLYGIVYSERPDTPSKTHLQSYFFSFKKRVIADPSFRVFWEKLFFSNNKFLVIRKCEMKLTKYFRDRGFKVGWFRGQDDLNNAIRSLTKSDLEVIARYQIRVDSKNSRRLEEFMDTGFQGENWRKDVNSLVEKRALGKYILIAHPLILFEHLGLPILKKDKQMVYRVQRDELLRRGLDKEFNSVVASEISERQKISAG